MILGADRKGDNKMEVLRWLGGISAGVFFIVFMTAVHDYIMTRDVNRVDN